MYFSFIKRFWGFIQSPKVRLCILAIYTAIAMTIGILTIYFTTRPSGMFFINAYLEDNAIIKISFKNEIDSHFQVYLLLIIVIYSNYSRNFLSIVD